MQIHDPVLRIEQADSRHLKTLLAFAERTFRDAYEHNNDPANFEDYITENFTPARFQADMDAPDSAYWLVWKGADLIAYCKLNLDKTPAELAPAKTVEIERIYVSKTVQGQGIGRMMLDFARQEAVKTGADWIWLGVWEFNTDAIAFYRKNGFEMFGSHAFLLGQECQTDFLMRKKV